MMELTATQAMFAERQRWMVEQINRADAAGNEAEKAKLIAAYQTTNHILQGEYGLEIVDEICRVACRNAGIPVMW